MFSQTGSAVQATRESAFRSERDARLRREANADAYIYRTSTATSSRKSDERPLRRDRFQLAIGVVLMSAIALGGLEVFARLCANTAMIR
jgi:hypothetical protein